MKIVVAQLCFTYDEAQAASRDPKRSERRADFHSIITDKRKEIDSLLDVEMRVLNTGHTFERVVEASAELSYFAAWHARRGGWAGSGFVDYPTL